MFRAATECVSATQGHRDCGPRGRRISVLAFVFLISLLINIRQVSARCVIGRSAMSRWWAPLTLNNVRQEHGSLRLPLEGFSEHDVLTRVDATDDEDNDIDGGP